ncbi:type VII secretion protein EccCa [Streptomyces hoynatensis]|uniref:Type VII secretion protein EccCa n=1 Tax=Streptomyces hoynatensis TaxID=1141874 RepID=A0A3A9ZBC9_9ACTN|nr:type VII secretion protein EccCa [Streptomyces hoynatensis]RKN45610.1 type VII secretion protein EccCa [Streptomyces hoynatensis]
MSSPPTVFRRPPRAARPAVPDQELVLKAPPELPRPEDGNLWMTALPALSGLGSVLYMLTMGRGPLGYVVGGMFLVSCLAMMAGSIVRQRGSAKSAARADRREYLRYLERVRAEVRRTAQAQREALRWDFPAPGTLWTVAASRRLWERRSGDEDFGTVRFGTGPRYLATRLVPGDSAPVEDLDPLCSVALKRFIDTHAVVPGLPVQVALRRFAAVRLTGEREAARALLRAVLAQAVTFHSPRDLRVAACVPEAPGRDWEWLKWLPHARHPEEFDHAGPVRMLFPGLAMLEEWLGAELARRARFQRDAEPEPDVPHLLIVLDGGLVTGTETLLDAAGLHGVTVLDLDGHAAALAEARGVSLQVTQGRLAVLAGELREELGEADALSVPEAEALAAALAPHRVDTAGAAGSEDRTTAVNTLPALLGLRDVGSLDLAALWRPRPLRDRLAVPIGVAADGGLLELDIKESAQNGMGPHGLLVGATGSGKSELLRTLVAGMAVTHPPDQLNFVLVDFKGGATFAGMAALPHVAAVITNLEDDLSLVDRMQEALSGEINRRQEVLRDAGNLVSVRDYERARQRGADLPPLPSLFIVVDEFSELLAQKPDFAELFVQIGRLGRSLGLHLLLASQRLDEGRLRGLEAHLSYRIGLRTFSEAESRSAIGLPDAHHLPSVPGHGYLRTDTRTLKRFRAAYVSGPYRSGEAGGGRLPGGGLDVRPFPAGYLPVPAEQRAPEPEPEPKADEFGEAEDLGSTVLGVMVEQMTDLGPRAHQVWLPPLENPAPLDALLGKPAERPGRGFGCSPRRPPLTAVVGIVDRPFHQRRDPLELDLAGAGGHVAVVGAPRSGKSTAVRALIASLALRHTPAEVQFYCLDFSGTLFPFARLPHVGGVAGRLDPELVNRTVAEVLEVMESREALFRELGVESMADYRAAGAAAQARGEGAGAPGEGPHRAVGRGRPQGDVFLVVDGWAVLRQSYPDLEQLLMALAGRMLTYGIHLVVTGNRWLDMRMGLRDLIGTKVELKLGDSLDSEMDRKAQRAIPAGRPGRGITEETLHFLTAVPRVDGVHSDSNLAAAVADLTERIDAAWQGPRAPAVRLLPLSYPLSEALAALREAAAGQGGTEQAAAGQGGSGQAGTGQGGTGQGGSPRAGRRGAAPGGVVVGVEANRLEPVLLTPGEDAGLVVIGDTESGKTSLLRAVGRQLVETRSPEEARLVVLDHRMTLLREFDGPHLLGYSTTHERSVEVVGGVAAGLRKRLPGTDVTPEQLRDRSWWHGPEIYLLVDDYDLLTTSQGNPLRPLLEFLPQARAIGLHLFLTRQAGGAARAVAEPVLGRLKELNVPAVVLSVPDEEMPIWGVRPARRAKGRGVLMHRRLGTVPLQLVRADSPLAAEAAPPSPPAAPSPGNDA